MTEQLEGQESLFDQDIWFGRTSPEPSRQMAAKISRPSSPRSSASRNQRLPMFLCLTADGLWREASSETDGVWRGAYTTRSFGERPSTLTEESSFPALPSGVEDSRLSQILVEEAHPKYYLSERACQGILNRAEKRGKELPEVLKNALMSQATHSASKGGCDIPTS